MKLDFLLDIFFPPTCVCCTQRIPHGTICGPCRVGLIVWSQPFSVVSDGGAGSYFIGAAGSYDNRILQTLIHALKFRFIKGAAEPLAEVLCTYIEGPACRTPAFLDNLNDFIVIPIPLSKRRERLRGFNQAALIAHIFAGQLGLPFVTDAMTRIRHRKPQSGTKNLAEREQNIRGCFAATSSVCAGKNIILIDDVTTSGATFLEAARTLTAAGAKKIIALAVARA